MSNVQASPLMGSVRVAHADPHPPPGQQSIRPLTLHDGQLVAVRKLVYVLASSRVGLHFMQKGSSLPNPAITIAPWKPLGSVMGEASGLKRKPPWSVPMLVELNHTSSDTCAFVRRSKRAARSHSLMPSPALSKTPSSVSWIGSFTSKSIPFDLLTCSEVQHVENSPVAPHALPFE